MRYIDADAFAKLMRDKAGDKKSQDEWVSGLQTGLLKAACMLETAPSADVVHIRHGTWKKVKLPPAGYNLHGWQCSECGYVDEVSHSVAETAFPYRYCPRCGARMENADNIGAW